MSRPVAIITGASSGIGLALTKHLHAQDWHIVLADLNPPPPSESASLPNTTYIQTDIASWSSQAALFQRTHDLHHRLDFLAANAGIDDRDDIFSSLDIPPTTRNPPNTATFAVNLTGSYYSVKLAAYYMSLSPSTPKPQPGGKIILTASAAGIYPLLTCPQYSATKHALIGLVRSWAPSASEANIRINAVCPALVKTGLAPPGLNESFRDEQFTPMSTILRCFDTLAEFGSVREAGWVYGGCSGEVVEGNLTQLVWHPAPERPKASSYQDAEGQEAWARAYRERNRDFVVQRSSREG